MGYENDNTIFIILTDTIYGIKGTYTLISASLVLYGLFSMYELLFLLFFLNDGVEF